MAEIITDVHAVKCSTLLRPVELLFAFARAAGVVITLNKRISVAGGLEEIYYTLHGTREAIQRLLEGLNSYSNTEW